MREHRVTGDGVTLAVQEHGDPAAPAMLLVHGFADTQDLWSLMVPLLTEHFHVITYDVRGAGASTVPDGGDRPYGMARLARDARAVIDAVVPGERVHLVGHDWGAIQGWEFLYAEPTRELIGSYTCISGACFDHVGLLLRERLRHPTPRSLLASLGQLRRSWYMFLLQAPPLFELVWRHVMAPRWGTTLKHLEGIPRGEDFPAPTIAADGANLAGLYWLTPFERLLKPIRTEPVTLPVQVVRPLGDRFLSPATLEGIEAFAPSLALNTVPGGHWAPRSCPGRLAELVIQHASAVGAS
jgi:pimeloyl-ACP methyl ester carboxylesterase